jgi:hypothetical protein
MTTIDKLDISVYNLYAIRTKMIEQINQQYHLEEAGTIPPQINIVNTNVQLSELELLLGVMPMHTPWAYFFPPKTFGSLRRSPFAFHRVAPSMGSFDDQAKDLSVIQSTQCKTPEEEKEKAVLTACFKEIDKLNNWLGFIVGRVGQFLQG